MMEYKGLRTHSGWMWRFGRCLCGEVETITGRFKEWNAGWTVGVLGGLTTLVLRDESTRKQNVAMYRMYSQFKGGILVNCIVWICYFYALRQFCLCEKLVAVSVRLKQEFPVSPDVRYHTNYVENVMVNIANVIVVVFKLRCCAVENL